MPRFAEPLRVSRAIGWRIAAIVLFGIAVGANLAHRMIWQAHKPGSPAFAETCLGLIAVVATWFGVLLLLHGHRLFRRRAAASASAGLEPMAVSFEDRRAMAEFLTARVLARARANNRAESIPRDVDRAD